MTMKNQTKTQKSQKWLIPGIVIAAVLVVAAILILGQGPKTDGLPLTINVQDAAQRFDAGAFLLDVREPSEWEQGHIDGAVLIPLGQLQDRIKEIPTEQDVLIICRSGNRSGQARDILRAAGLKRTTSIDGGMNSWIAAGLRIVTGN